MDFDEYVLQPGQEATDRWMNMRVGDYMANMSLLLDVMVSGGHEEAPKRLDDAHRELVRDLLDKIIDKSENAFEQAALTSMVGTTLLATFNGQIDYLNFQLDMLENESMS